MNEVLATHWERSSSWPPRALSRRILDLQAFRPGRMSLLPSNSSAGAGKASRPFPTVPGTHVRPGFPQTAFFQAAAPALLPC